MRAVDVDHIERDRDPRRAPRLGNELVGHQMRRHLIQNPRHLERQRDLAPQPPGSLKRHGCDLRGRRPLVCRGLLDLRRDRCQRVSQRPAGREVAIQRRATHPGRSGDLRHADLPIAGQRRRGLEDPPAALSSVSAKKRRLAYLPLSRRHRPSQGAHQVSRVIRCL